MGMGAIVSWRSFCGPAVNNGAQARVPVPLEAGATAEMLWGSELVARKSKEPAGRRRYGSECVA
jgi:hypothetical protein